MSTTADTVLLRVRSCRKRASGKRRGAPWVLYAVDVVDEDGQELELPAFSFFACRRGLQEFEIEQRDHPRYGASFTLTPIAGADGTELLERVEALEERVAALAALVYESQGVAA